MIATLTTSSTSSALAVQCRVIVALILREVHTLYGHTKLGYLWAIIMTAFQIGIFWIIRLFLGAHAPHGMGMAVFLLCGFIPLRMFSDTVMRCMAAVNGNRALLTFPQVTELDLMLARTAVVWGTQLVCALVILSLALALGEPMTLHDPASLASTLIFAPLLGLGVGTIFSSIACFWSTLERLVPLLMRFFFFTSGVFFEVSELPARFSEYLMINPLAHLIEWQRHGFSLSAISPLHSISYVIVWCLFSLSLGLLLERHMRGKKAL